MEENKNKVIKRPFTDLFDKEFPELNKKNINSHEDLVKSVLSDSKLINLITESIIKIILMNKTQNTTITAQTVLGALQETISNKNSSKVNG